MSYRADRPDLAGVEGAASQTTPRAPAGEHRGRTRSAVGLLTLFTLTPLAVTGFALYQALTWPDVRSLGEHDPSTTAFIRLGTSEPVWVWVPYEEISPHLKRAVVVAEDIRFFFHRGFALDEMQVALTETLRSGKPLRGASTITQQVAKNLWLSPSRHPWRKLKEAVLTVQLEHYLSKRRILEIYLNVAELGPGIYGVEAAARHYFGKPAAQLSIDESAALAAVLPRPSSWHPGSPSRVYRRHVQAILRRMAKAAWLEPLI